MPHNIKGECRNSGRTWLKKGLVPWNKGKKMSAEFCRKNSESNMGRISPRKGVKLSEETKKRISVGISKTLIGNTRTKDKPWSLNRRNAQVARNGKPYRRKPISNCKPLIKNGKEYHPIWNEIRKVVYKRDGWICQECGQHCHSNIACHHIDYDTQNSDMSNLITLCSSCHAKTNFKRVNWIVRYLNKILKGSDVNNTFDKN